MRASAWYTTKLKRVPADSCPRCTVANSRGMTVVEEASSLRCASLLAAGRRFPDAVSCSDTCAASAPAPAPAPGPSSAKMNRLFPRTAQPRSTQASGPSPSFTPSTPCFCALSSCG